MKQKEIGGLMGIDYSAVSVMRKRLFALHAGQRSKTVGIGRKAERAMTAKSRIKI